MRNSSVYARTASVRVCSWNCSCPICSRSAIIEIELDLALGTAKIENIHGNGAQEQPEERESGETALPPKGVWHRYADFAVFRVYIAIVKKTAFHY